MLLRRNTGLVRISLSSEKPEHYYWPPHKNDVRLGGAEAMCYDPKRNSLWINSYGGLMEFTLKDKQFHQVEALKDLVKKNEGNRWVGIDLDPLGRVWFATIPHGILIYDPTTQTVIRPFAEDTALSKTVSDFNWSIYCDKDGSVWSGSWTLKGIYQLVPFPATVTRFTADAVKPRSLSNNHVFNLINAGRGKLWIGTVDGLNIFDIHTGLFQVLRAKNLNGISRNSIYPLAIDSFSQKAWLATGFPTGKIEFFVMDMVTRNCTPVKFKNNAGHLIPGFDNFRLNFRLGTITGNNHKIAFVVLAGYHNWQGVFILHKDSTVAQQVLVPMQSFNKSKYNNLVYDDTLLFLNQEGVTGGLTYTHNNGKWIAIPGPLDSAHWIRLFPSKEDQTYWVTSFQQLIHYDKEFRVIYRYTPKEGLPALEIYSVIPDNRGNIWFNTDRSIYQLIIRTGKITRLTENDGFLPFHFTAFPRGIKDDHGDIYFTARFHERGFIRISPEKFRETYPPSMVYVQSLEINQTRFPLSTGVNDLQELSLKYFQNTITIETGVIDYYSNGNGRIRYKLEGINQDWQYAPAYYTIRYDGLGPGEYRLLIQASNAANEFNGPVKSLQIRITPALWNTTWFRIAAFIFLVAIIYTLIRWRLHQKFSLQLERSEKEKQLADMRQKTGELEMQALRAQMNPHFIFNSLNSINRFILQNNKAQASEYLTKFSRLVRLILQNSQVALIPLASELEALKLYLELESVRFDHHFEYNLKVDDELETDILKVPPLIIQPYAENAIWHGLMHKEEKGHLEIKIFQRDDDVLYCKITDDGIGRKKAAELKSKSPSTHKSVGMQITADRISILQQKKQFDTTINITDLVLPDGSAGGTEVILKIPVML